jgi:uncharacterized membrane protein YeiH
VADNDGSALLIFSLQMAATMFCAVGGALAAGRKRLDVVGVVFVSFVAAVGGGSLRDLLLDRNPVFWLAQPSYLTASLVAGALTWLFIRRWRAADRFLTYVDAFGLALFTISGIQIAQEMSQSTLICLVMGVITGVAGGLLRDLLCGEIPSVFKGGELYASAALIGGAVFFLAAALGANARICALAGATAIIGLRLAALRLGWRLPVLEIKRADNPDR